MRGSRAPSSVGRMVTPAIAIPCLLIAPPGPSLWAPSEPRLELAQRLDLLEQTLVQYFPVDPRRFTNGPRDFDGLARSYDPISCRIEGGSGEFVVDEFVIVCAADQRSLFIDEGQAGQDAPLEIEIAVTLAEPDPGVRVDGACPRDYEVESAKRLDEVEVNGLPEDQRTVQGAGKPLLSLWNLTRFDEEETHHDCDRLQHRSLFPDDFGSIDVQTVVWCHEDGAIPVVERQGA